MLEKVHENRSFVLILLKILSYVMDFEIQFFISNSEMNDFIATVFDFEQKDKRGHGLVNQYFRFIQNVLYIMEDHFR